MLHFDEAATGGTTGTVPSAPAATGAPASSPASTSPASPSTPAARGQSPLPRQAPLANRLRDRVKAAGGAKLGAETQPGQSPSVLERGTGTDPNAQPAAPGATNPGEQVVANPADDPNTDFSLLGYIRDGLGVDFGSKYRDDEQLVHGLVHAAQMVGRRDADAEYGRQVRQYEPQFRAFLAGAQPQQFQNPNQPPAPQQQQPQRPPGDAVWNMPEWNPGWSQFLVQVQDPQTGETRTELHPQTPQQVRQGIDQFRAAKHAFDTSWGTNPRAMVENLVGQIFEQRFKEGFEQSLGQERSHATAQQIVQRNNEWMFQRTENGQPIFDGMTGKPALSPRGERYMFHIQKTMQLTPDPALADHLAQELATKDILVQALTAFQQGGALQNGGQPGSPGLVPAINGQPAAVPPGARRHSNATAGAAPGQPVQMKFPPGIGIAERIRRIGLARQRVSV